MSTRSIIDDAVRQSGRSIPSHYLDRAVQTVEANPGNPMSALTDLVRNLGGRVEEYRPIIDRVVTALETQTTQATGLSDPTQGFHDLSQHVADIPSFEEIAGRLRDFASEQGLPMTLVEEALVYSGLVEQQDEEQDEADPAVGAALDALSAAVEALRNALL